MQGLEVLKLHAQAAVGLSLVLKGLLETCDAVKFSSNLFNSLANSWVQLPLPIVIQRGC